MTVATGARQRSEACKYVHDGRHAQRFSFIYFQGATGLTAALPAGRDDPHADHPSRPAPVLATGSRPRRGCTVEANADGALTRLEARGLSLLLNPATSIEAGPPTCTCACSARRRRRDALPCSAPRPRAACGRRRRPAWPTGTLGRARLPPRACAWRSTPSPGRWHLEVTNHRRRRRRRRRRAHPRPGPRARGCGAPPTSTTSASTSTSPRADTPDHGTALGRAAEHAGRARARGSSSAALGRGDGLGHRRAPAGPADPRRASLERPRRGTSRRAAPARARPRRPPGRAGRPRARAQTHRTGFVGHRSSRTTPRRPVPTTCARRPRRSHADARGRPTPRRADDVDERPGRRPGVRARTAAVWRAAP